SVLDHRASALHTARTPTLAYQVSKDTLVRLCQRRARAWRERGARLLALSPELVAAPRGNRGFQNQPVRFDPLAHTRLQRQGNSHELADGVQFLASDRASFTSRIGLLVDGGIHAALRHGARV